MFRIILTALLLLTASPAVADVLIIAHRGASGERPEHTRAAYELAVAQGADFIEPDLVMTRDGVLVVRHENEIGGTTDVASHSEFADRRVTKTIDGQTVTGWFTEDFTLAELMTLRARERLPELRGTAFDGQQPILTFEQVLEIAAEATARTGRTIGVAPELKHPAYFKGIGLPMEDAFVAVLERRGLTGADAPVLVQCFEVGPLERLSRRVGTPLLQLMARGGGPADRPELTYAAMATPEGLARVRAYADWIGADTAMIEPQPGAPTALIADAHAADLKVAAWTFRAENAFLPEGDRIGDGPAEHGRITGRVARFAGYGLDAAFMDQPRYR
ncbi:glycerophosphodiester phosphodiesterase family protein [Brevundimonas sp. M20]|uniref:glycerophosphodiester phosphodiesterase family protein n=1 Tax=Brevundimonas sp. M20 TaxID=2591463 RepID=UPI001146581F|nr:glycerophosphodiester phosphodiesterase family protein [Brevundimonas sp. M20]QDH72722.1 glycerophosphodiester phosphodiesterase [Brevundimonas sp. M20]